MENNYTFNVKCINQYNRDEIKSIITDRCTEMGYNLDVDKMLNYYEERGWKMKGKKTQIKNWNKVVDNWAERQGKTTKYSDQLKTIYWQKRRNEVLIRDNYTCCLCDAEHKQLSVHHIYYEPDKKAWEYDDECYVSLCDDCHKAAHKEIAKISALISLEVLRNKMMYVDVCKLLNIL